MKQEAYNAVVSSGTVEEEEVNTVTRLQKGNKKK